MNNKMNCLLIFSLLSFASLQGEESKTHGLIPLKDHETTCLETSVNKVVQVYPNSLGLTRISQHFGTEYLSEVQDLSSEHPEFTLLQISSDEAAGMISKSITSSNLPTSVNNSLLPSFPLIGDQGQLGSCVAWGSTYYQSTHEIGLLNGINNKTGMQGVLSPKWTYDILNNGVDDGLSVLSAYQLLAINGAPSIASFPYDSNYTAWDLNVQDWVAAINNRMANYAMIPGLGGSGAQNLTAIKTALLNGHVLTFATFIDSWVFTQIKTDPQNINNAHIGEYAAVYMDGTNGGHFLTIVGYDDSLWVDVNGNGQVDSGERGAFLIANSWGSSWGNQGFIWISYDAFLATSGVAGGPKTGRVAAGSYLNSSVITVVPKAQNYTPKLIAQFSLSQTIRDQIAILAGTSSVNQTTPTQLITDYALSDQGGALEFNGSIGSIAEAATFALDYSDFLVGAAVPATQRYYLKVSDNATGNPTVLNSYSLVDLVHNNQVNSPNLPITYDNSSGTVFIDYNFSQGSAPVPVVPVVSFSSPQTGATLTGTVQITAQASDSLGISNVQLYADSVLIGSMTASGSSYEASLNTTSLSNGTHVLKVVATNTSNNTAVALVSVQVQNSVQLPSFFINAGGPSVASSGETWVSDSGYFSGGIGTSKCGLSFANPVYQTERYGNMTYHFSVPNGEYSVTLKLAEIYFHAANHRVFNVAINGVAVVHRLDLAAVAGYGVPHDLTFPVTVTNGVISIVFTSVVNNAKISGIEIVPGS